MADMIIRLDAARRRRGTGSPALRRIAAAAAELLRTWRDYHRAVVAGQPAAVLGARHRAVEHAIGDYYTLLGAAQAAPSHARPTLGVHIPTAPLLALLRVAPD